MYTKIALILILVLKASPSHGALYLQLSPAPNGGVNLFIEASGFITATQDNFLLIGSIDDTFLPDKAPQRYSGLVPSAPTPNLTLGGVVALNNFYRDGSGASPPGLSSLLGFYFGEGTLDGVLDLSDLNGTYFLPESRFSDFVVGTYTGLRTGVSPNTLQGIENITLRVIPEPSHYALILGLGLLGLIAARRKRIIAN